MLMNKTGKFASSFQLIILSVALLLGAGRAMAAGAGTGAVAINVDTVVNDEITLIGEIDEFTFNANSGDVVYFHPLTGGARHALVWTLLSPSGATIFDEDFFKNQGADLLPETGQYSLTFADSQNRAGVPYSFELISIPDPVAIPLNVDERTIGTVDLPGSLTQYEFAGTTGQRLYFESEAVLDYRNMMWRLIRPDSSIAFDGVSLRTNPLEPRVLTQDGNYLIEVYGTRDSIGDFVFTLHTVPDTPIIPISMNEPVMVHFDVPGVMAIYEFDADIGQTLYIDKLSGPGSLGFHWKLLDPNGLELAKTVNGSMADLGPVTTGTSGRHQILIDGYGKHSGAMSFQVLEAATSNPPQNIALEQFVTGALEVPTETQDYVFSATAGDSLRFHSIFRQVGFRFKLTAPDGSVVFQNADRSRSFTAPLDGEYILHVAGYEGSAGGYTFIVSTSATTPPYPPVADLIPGNILAPSRVVGDPASIEVSWTVTNQGAASASNWSDFIVMTQGGSELGTVSLVGPQRRVVAQIAHNLTLAPGESYSDTATVVLPAGFEGDFSVTVEADGLNQILEQITNNNAADAGFNTWVQRQLRTLEGEVTISLDQADGQHYPQGTQLSLSGQVDLFPGAMNALFLMDVSGSTRPDYTDPIIRPVAIGDLDANADGQVNIFDDLNSDSYVGDILDTEIGAVLNLVEKLQSKSEDLRVATLLFAGNSWPADSGVAAFSQALVDPAFNTSVGQRLADFNESIQSAHVVNGFLTGAEKFNRVWVPNGTNFQKPVQRAAQVIQNGPRADRTLVFMMTDGESVGALHTQADIDALTVTDISFFAYQIGSGAIKPELQALVDGINATPGSSAVAYAVTDPNDLITALSSTLELAGVAVNGRGVQSLDATGHFFTPVTLQAGANDFLIEAIDSNGRNSVRSFTLHGDVSTGNAASVRDLAGSSTAQFTNTRYNRQSHKLLTDITLLNSGNDPLVGPFSATARPIIPALVTLGNPSSVDAQGVPVIDFTLLNGDTDLAVAGLTAAFAGQFENPAEQRFSIQLNPFGSANTAPQISSTPLVTVLDNAVYSYAVLAADADGHALSYSLTQSPANMSIDVSSGQINWTPGPAQLGLHQVSLRVEDGYGGSDTQSFQLSVLDSRINYPPLFQSTPMTALASGLDYQYIPQVLDPNGDALNYRLTTPVPGFTINPLSGVIIAATPRDGDYDLEIEVDDARGGLAAQGYRLSVGGAVVSGVPVISSTPGVDGAPAKLYLYQPLASDPDGDVLSYILLAAPPGMQIDPLNGRIMWTPDLNQLGPHIVALRVEDPTGNYATQFFTIEVSANPQNLSPAIVSVPPLLAGETEPYQYLVEAIDPNGDVLSYLLLDGPATMNIDGSSGLLSYTPAAGSAGTSVTVGLQAVDGRGGIGEQSFTLEIRPPNQAPVFISTPLQTISAGAVYHYVAEASDDDTVSYQLSSAPAGMSIDAQSGLLSMITSPAQIGAYPVVVRATDERGLFAEQAYTLTIEADAQAPQVSILAQPSLVIDLGESVTLEVRAVDDVDIQMAAKSLDIDGVPIPLNATGIGQFTANTAGLFTLRATATDSSGNIGETTLQLRVIDPADQTPPEISFDSPVPGEILGQISDIVGSIVETGQLEFYYLDYAAAEHINIEDIAAPNDAWVRIAEGDQTLSHATFGRFDVSAVRNGDYLLRVMAQDTSGNIGIKVLPVAVVSGKLGRLSFEVLDIELPQAGQAIRVLRRYDSFDAANQGDFGQGWRLSYADPDIRETVPVHPNEQSSAGLVANPFVEGTRLYLNNPEGQRIGFTFQTTSSGSLLGAIYHPEFVADPGVYDRLEVDDISLSQRADGSFVYFLLGFAYNPSNFRLVRPDGSVYHYNQFEGLKRISDLNGNEITFDSTGIHNSDGGGLDFVRDASGRISRIIDEAGGTINYHYDSVGNLSEVVDQIGDRTVYRYYDQPAHYLNEIEDSLGNVEVVEYDASGRFSGFTDASGNRSSQVWDSDTFTGTITDANGNVRELLYDVRGNLLSSTDALGNTTAYAYDLNNRRTSETDARGNITQYSYDANGNEIRRIDPLGNETLATFDANANQTDQTNALGARKQTLFDARGNLTQAIFPGGASASFAYDARGRMISSTDYRGSVTHYQYTGGASKPSQVTSPQGEITLYEYNQFGQVTAMTDPLGRVTRYSYDAQGNLLELISALGDIQRFSYQQGRAVSGENALGQRTLWTYDEKQRVSSVTLPSGAVLQYRYDALDNRTRITDPAGNVTQYTYDALNRLISETDPSGNTRQYDYDITNNRIRSTDRNGRVREFDYDANNRMISERWLDGAVVINQIDTSYDEIGRILSVSDANSALSFSYDARNRIIQSDNQGTAGVPRRVLNYSYDDNDNLVQVVDDQGVQLDSIYDLNNRLLTRVLQGSASVRADISYDANGDRSQLLRSNDSVGASPLVNSVYQRDDLGRITALTHVNGNSNAIISSFNNQFDGVSKLTRAEHHGQVFQYGYDTDGQLLDTSRSLFANESFSYDVTGNRSNGGMSVVANGNRLLSDAQFTYQYDSEGNLIQRRDSVTGETVQFSYDHMNHLTGAERRNAVNVLLATYLYTYDATGRRILRNEDGVLRSRVYSQSLPWLDQTGANNTYYLFSDQIDEVIASIDSSGKQRGYLSDHQGTVFDLIDEFAVVVNRIDYDSFGLVRSQSNPAEAPDQYFTGRELDGTGLYHYRSRAYDPLAGRFTSEDSIGFEGGDYNLYRYVGNSPQNATDPSGNSASEYASLLCELVVPLVGPIKTYASCLEKMYEGIAMSVASLEGGSETARSFYGCVGKGIVDQWKGKAGSKLLGKGGEEIRKMMPNPPKYLGDPLTYASLACNAGGF